MTVEHPRAEGGDLVARLAGTLVVSCQAPPGHPFAGPQYIAALCRCAEGGGAAGVRVDATEGVTVAREAVSVAVIGLKKAWTSGRRLTNGRPAITPTVEDARSLAAAGADIVAFEATRELHGEELLAHLRAVRSEIDAVLLADVSTLAEGLAAFEAGVDLVGSTLSGYTPDSPSQDGPDLHLVAELAARGVPTVAEGRIREPDEARVALEAGAHFVVVGGAITDPLQRTTRFVEALEAVRFTR